jgi:hypothetical protein
MSEQFALILAAAIAVNGLVIFGAPAIYDFFDRYKGVSGIHRKAAERQRDNWFGCRKRQGTFCSDCRRRGECFEECVAEIKREIDYEEETRPPNELKPCKCGGEAIFGVERISSGGTITRWSVHCKNPKCRNYLYGVWMPTREESAREWNRRAAI